MRGNLTLGTSNFREQDFPWLDHCWEVPDDVQSLTMIINHTVGHQKPASGITCWWTYCSILQCIVITFISNFGTLNLDEDYQFGNLFTVFYNLSETNIKVWKRCTCIVNLIQIQVDMESMYRMCLFKSMEKF